MTIGGYPYYYVSLERANTWVVLIMILSELYI